MRRVFELVQTSATFVKTLLQKRRERARHVAELTLLHLVSVMLIEVTLMFAHRVTNWLSVVYGNVGV